MSNDEIILSEGELKEFSEVLKKLGNVSEEVKVAALEYLAIFKKRSSLGVRNILIQGKFIQ